MSIPSPSRSRRSLLAGVLIITVLCLGGCDEEEARKAAQRQAEQRQLQEQLSRAHTELADAHQRNTWICLLLAGSGFVAITLAVGGAAIGSRARRDSERTRG